MKQKKRNNITVHPQHSLCFFDAEQTAPTGFVIFKMKKHLLPTGRMHHDPPPHGERKKPVPCRPPLYKYQLRAFRLGRGCWFLHQKTRGSFQVGKGLRCVGFFFIIHSGVSPSPPPPSIARSYVLFFGNRVRSQPAITRLALDTSRVNGWQNRLKCALWVKQSARPDFAFQ